MEIPDNIITEWYRSFRRKHWLFQLVLLILIILVSFLFARVGFLGESIQKPLEKITPIKFLDCDESKFIRVAIHAEINGQIAQRDGNYKSGALVKLIVNISKDNYLLVFGVDKNGSYSLMNNSYESVFFSEDSPFTKEIQLDEVVGKEVYYAIASNCPFSYDKVIKPEIEKIQNQTKGFEKSDFELDIALSHDYFHFNHSE